MSRNSSRPKVAADSGPSVAQEHRVSPGGCELLKLRERANRCRQIKREHRFAADWLQPSLSGTRRWTGRTKIQLTTEFRPRGTKGSKARVTDISAYGCRLERVGMLPVGSYSWVKFPTLESWYARVAWCDGTAAGLDFAEPLHPAVTDMLIARAEATGNERTTAVRRGGRWRSHQSHAAVSTVLLGPQFCCRGGASRRLK